MLSMVSVELSANGPLADVINYALTLEHLGMKPPWLALLANEVLTQSVEDTFYRQGLANFSAQQFLDAGYSQTFYDNLKEIAYDEATHVNFLTAALGGMKGLLSSFSRLTFIPAAGAPAVKECTYSFNIPNVQAFVATASVLEGVGVSAYLGAAGLIASKAYLTAAGSILTSESRHNAYLRSILGARPFPQSFDVPLDYDEVQTMAYPFFVSCPSDNPKFLPVKAFPGLSASSTGTIQTGATITLTAGMVNGVPFKIAGGPMYAVWISATGPVFVPALGHGDMLSWDVQVPPGIHGQSYVLLTGCNTTVTDDTVTAGPTIVEVQGSNGAPTLLP
jgi:hypothetical protein